ncbi:MAG: hypothetical protein NTU80_05885 [Verrucomicrobia bacterium]|nr:hypothetical protein [Verrucomicrobiota bacterium]
MCAALVDAPVEMASPWRASLRAARANLVPGLILQAFAGALVAAYFFSGTARAALERLAAWRVEIGPLFGVVTTAVFGAVVPFLVLGLRAGTRGRYTGAQMAALIAFWGYKGLEVAFFYGWQARVFGEAGDFTTIALKTFVDQFVYCPLVAVPCTWAVYAWVEYGFQAGPLWAEWRRPGWYGRCVLPLLIATWGVWTPAVALIYVLPTALQLPLQNVVLCFFTLLVIFMTKRESAREQEAGN